MARQTGKVEGADGSLIPTKPGLWFGAAQRLIEAQSGIEEIEAATDRVNYETGFVRFVESIEECWTSFFDEGKENFTDFQPWAGKYQKLRNEDELLRYIYQARHKSQHGRYQLDWGPATIQIAPGYNGNIRDLKIFENGSFEVDAHPSSDKHANKVQIKQNYGDPKLPAIENRGVMFHPPTVHLGEELADCSPLNITKCASDFYTSALMNALEKFSLGAT